jgi:hypothetical protein
VASCTVSGYSDAPGQHVLTAVATNGAGLSSTNTLVYVVTPAPVPAAISGLSSTSGLTLRRLVRSGMKVTVAVASANTKLTVSLVAKVPRSKGHKARTIPLTLLSIRAHAGTAQLHLVLKRAMKRSLGGVAKATVTVTVVASAPGTTATKLARSRVLRR